MWKVFYRSSQRLFLIGTALIALVLGLSNRFFPDADTWNMLLLPATFALFWAAATDLRAHLSLGVPWQKWFGSNLLTIAGFTIPLSAIGAVTAYIGNPHSSLMVRSIPSTFTIEPTISPASSLALTFTIFFCLIGTAAALGTMFGALMSQRLSSIMIAIISLSVFGGLAFMYAVSSEIYPSDLTIHAPVPGVYIFTLPPLLAAIAVTAWSARRGL
ncbi:MULTISPECIES: hypothetical protein [unclassified Corynebacterium]|uniref:hypothetical protein n=1 Tax=unclassified Corynebacterium TaxID=2624378 RepID=UPI0029C9C0BE|nr:MULTISPECIES: hypothetical protein [unclassified Corynebacterium]WPF66592.1 hypothetical protein OLX12_02345 [Corynebacterium sp. 22KM0430]WPF69080.1 hypothetical protein OLW90_02340 [Corynebacterium sp. 21KM1197]